MVGAWSEAFEMSGKATWRVKMQENAWRQGLHPNPAGELTVLSQTAGGDRRDWLPFRPRLV